MSNDTPIDNLYEAMPEESHQVKKMVALVEKLFEVMEKTSTDFPDRNTSVGAIVERFMKMPIESARKRMLQGHFFVSDEPIDVEHLEKEVDELNDRRSKMMDDSTYTFQQYQDLSDEIRDIMDMLRPYYLKSKLDTAAKEILTLDKKEQEDHLSAEEADHR